jgi:hypothetical protein
MLYTNAEDNLTAAAGAAIAAMFVMWRNKGF